MKSEKRHLTEEMEQQNQGKIGTFREKTTYKYLDILDDDTIKLLVMK